MRKTKFINFFLISVLVILDLNMLFNSSNISDVLRSASLILILFIPFIIRNILKINTSYLVEMIYLIFIFFATLGNAFHFYSVISGYDSFLHFTSSILTCVIALNILVLLKKYDKKSVIFNVLFMVSITMMAAALWEIFEFSMDSLLLIDAQRVKLTGVKDTMIDMICALTGSLLVSILYIIESKTKKIKIFKTIIESLD